MSVYPSGIYASFNLREVQQDLFKPSTPGERSRLLSINVERLLLAIGLIVGIAVWALFNQRIVGCLKQRTFRANTIAAVEGLIGTAVFLVNAGLVYLATMVANFFLFSFAVLGLLVGAWITIPASFE